MTIEKKVRYIIYGAGAVGTSVGGMLVQSGAPVVFVARPAFAGAIEHGMLLKLKDREIHFTGEAVSAIDDLSPAPDDVIIITTKSQATESVIDDLATVYDRSTPVVCLQNGIRNEEIAARKFANVYAGLVFLSAVQREPSTIVLPGGLDLAVGCYPDGVDDVAHRVAEDFTRAGFRGLASPYVMAMKWGKLVANLNNATHAITGYWLEMGLADPEMRSLTLRVREEGLHILDTAGIAVEPPADQPSPIRIRAWTDKLRQPASSWDEAANLPADRRTYSSMWQDLHLGRSAHEADFLNGEIVRIGERLGIPTPYNSTLIKLMDRMVAERQPPGRYSPAELRAVIESGAANDA